MVRLPQSSLGVGDRFGRQARAQLKACELALSTGVEVTPVWNKSNREHKLIGSEPSQTRLIVDAAVRACWWTKPYFVDADHVTMETISRFVTPCDYFTFDVADSIGKRASSTEVEAFVRRHPELIGDVSLPQTGRVLHIERSWLELTASKFLTAVEEAGSMYSIVSVQKGEGTFIAELSMDEVAHPQTPAELLVILAALGDVGVPLQTIAPKFSGRFNKGVDYVGDIAVFENELASDAAVIALAIQNYGLPDTLKLSIHSGSDKFGIYRSIYKVLVQTNSGVHLKTAGTTWLEEVMGLAEAGGAGLQIAKEIYGQAYENASQLAVPYETVLDIDPAELPSPQVVNGWTGPQYCTALKNSKETPGYNRSFRQLLHIAFKIAAGMGQRYLDALDQNEEIISRNVTTNLFERHIRPIFLGEQPPA